jgi:hypothetical protein
VLSPTTYAYDDGPLLGALSVINDGEGPHEFEIVSSDPPNMFAIDGDDFETPSVLYVPSPTVTIRARRVDGPGPWIGPQTFPLNVTGLSFVLLENDDRLLLESGHPVAIDLAIPAQPVAGALAGTEEVAIVQGGVTKRLALSTLAEFL